MWRRFMRRWSGRSQQINRWLIFTGVNQLDSHSVRFGVRYSCRWTGGLTLVWVLKSTPFGGLVGSCVTGSDLFRALLSGA